ncbi:hypothetical protein BN871_DA_00040 [Paenibacillus sp. P22]|nr:hypothetical protein BN871_DA_00040 [Paenibacillus sp. P22]
MNVKLFRIALIRGRIVTSKLTSPPYPIGPKNSSRIIALAAMDMPMIHAVKLRVVDGLYESGGLAAQKETLLGMPPNRLRPDADLSCLHYRPRRTAAPPASVTTT